MIYAAFSVWLFLVLLAAMGVYSLWTRLAKPAWVNWALLPGTIISEMAYILGCLITGGEIRRSRILPGAGQSKGGDGEPTTEAAPKLKILGPIIAALFCIVACGGAIIALHGLLGEPVMKEFQSGGDKMLSQAALSRQLPSTGDEFWDQVESQVRLLRRMSATWRDLEWTDWHNPLFVYLAICLSVRLAPANRPLRSTLAAVVVIAAVIAIVGTVSKTFTSLMADLWPLLTYVWATLLFLLVITLLVLGVVSLVKALASGGSGGGGGKGGRKAE